MSSVINYLYEFGSFRLDPARRLLERNGSVVPLKPKVFDTLLVLVASSGKVVDKEELLKEVWGGAIVEEVGLAKNISTLRKALGESPDEHRYIVTVPGRGYQFVANVTTVSAPTAEIERVEIDKTDKDEIDEAIIETHTISRVTSEEEIIDVQAAPPQVLSGPQRASRSLRIGIVLGGFSR